MAEWFEWNGNILIHVPYLQGKRNEQHSEEAIKQQCKLNQRMKNPEGNGRSQIQSTSLITIWINLIQRWETFI